MSLFSAGIIAGARRRISSVDFRMDSRGFTLSGGSGVQTITIPGFGTPKACMIFFNTAGFGGTQTRVNHSIGFYDGTTERCFSAKISGDEGPQSTNGGSGAFPNLLTEISNSFANNSLVDTWSAVGFVQDGIEIQVDIGTSAAHDLHVIFWGGAALESVVVGDFDADAYDSNGFGTESTGHRTDVAFFGGCTDVVNSSARNGCFMHFGLISWNGSSFDQVGQSFNINTSFSYTGYGAISNDGILRTQSDEILTITGRGASDFTFQNPDLAAINELIYMSFQLSSEVGHEIVQHESPEVPGIASFYHDVEYGVWSGAIQLHNTMPAYNTVYDAGDGNGQAITVLCRSGDARTMIYASEEGGTPNSNQAMYVDEPCRTLFDDGTVAYEGYGPVYSDDGYTIDFDVVDENTSSPHQWPALHFATIP